MQPEKSGQPPSQWPALFVCRRNGAPNAPARACKAAAPAIKAGTVTDFAIPPKVAVSSDVQKWTRKDPMITPGQARLPNRRIQPSARPAAGQTAVAYPGGMARKSANLPVTK